MSTRVEHAVAHGAALAEVVLERDDADVGRGVLRGECECEGCGGVLGAVVDDDEFVGARGGGEVCEGGGEHGGEAGCFVVGRNDDAQVEAGWVGEGGEGKGCWGRV